MDIKNTVKWIGRLIEVEIWGRWIEVEKSLTQNSTLNEYQEHRYLRSEYEYGLVIFRSTYELEDRKNTNDSNTKKIEFSLLREFIFVWRRTRKKETRKDGDEKRGK